MKRILITALLTLIFSSCARINSEQTSNITDVIDFKKCSKPCWLGIEQGMALEVDEVINILGSYYGEQNVVLNTGGLNPKHGFQSIIWRNNTESNEIPSQRGGVTLDENGQVFSIRVGLEERWFTVGDLISSVGEPDLVVILNVNNHLDGSPCGVWRLHYPSLGFSVDVWQDENPKIIEASDYLSYILFSKSWLENETAVNDYFNKLVSWNGYGDYSQFCAKEKTPSP